MEMKYVKLAGVTALSVSLLTGFGFGDLSGSLDKDDVKDAAKVVAIGVAVKLIADMLIETKTVELSNEEKVVSDYKKTHSELPAEFTLVNYSSSVKPGDVVSVGSTVDVASTLTVVRSKNQREFTIEEKLSIYESDDHSKVMRSLTKEINPETKRSGEFSNSFSFKMPEGMPQGVYPVKSTVIVAGKELKTSSTKMQLVLNVDAFGQYQFAALDVK